jgi:nucleoside phosphorylase
MSNNSTHQKIGIVVAMEIEAMPLVEKIPFDIREVFGFTVYQNINIVLLVCGVGKVNASLGTFILIHQLHCTSIINYGIAGYTGKGNSFGSIYSVNKIRNLDLDFTAIGAQPYSYPDRDDYVELVEDKTLPAMECFTTEEYISPKSNVPIGVLVDMVLIPALNSYSFPHCFFSKTA